jgi:hypothetical protein
MNICVGATISEPSRCLTSQRREEIMQCLLERWFEIEGEVHAALVVSSALAHER